MIFLLLSVVSSSLIFLIFKWLGKLKVSNLTVIVMNYLFAGLIGWIIQGPDYLEHVISSSWLLSAVMLGSIFVGMFYLMARTTQLVGTSPSVVANKMSVVIPIIVAFLVWKDHVNAWKIGGIILALLGIYLVTRKKDRHMPSGQHSLLLMLVFIGSGFIDTMIKLIEQTYLSDDDIVAFTTVLFQTAFLSGLILLCFNYKRTLKSFKVKKIFLGFLLGSVNFASIYFLILTLKEGQMESSVVFPLNNIGIVLLSAVLSRLIFKEHLSSRNMAGIAVSILSMLLLMIGRQL